MKIAIGNTPINSLNIHSYEMNTNDATLQASDLQSGITAYARGRKVEGTGKSFEFAYYGAFEANDSIPVPDNINVIEIACITNPVQLSIELSNMKTIDFTTKQTVGNVVVGNTSYPITAQVTDNVLTIGCSTPVRLEIFCGKDNYTHERKFTI